jgi:predicted PurR-regulated permease PerM
MISAPVVFAILLGGALFGPVSAVLAVPIAVVVQVVVTRLLDLLLLGDPAAGRE